MANKAETDRKQETLIRKTRAAINGLSHTNYLRIQLEQAGATWRAGRNGGLEMVFVNQNEFVGLRCFGKENVIGIKVLEEGTNPSEIRQRLLSDRELSFMVRMQHANIALVTEEELSNWVAYYQQVENTGLTDRLGWRAYASSGLERVAPEMVREARGLLKRMLAENEDYLRRCGAVSYKNLSSLDVAFLDSEGRFCEVPLSWVKQIERRGQIGEQTIVDQMTVVGIMLPFDNESKREFEERCLKFENDYYARYKVRVRIARGSPGQINLWRKLGFGEHGKSSYEEASVTPGEVWRYLYFGKSNLEPGPLTLSGLALPGLGEEYYFPGIDIVFLRRNSRGAQEYALIDAMAALDPHALRRGQMGVIPLNSVVGIKIIPDDWTWDQVKNDAEAQSRVRDAIYNMGMPGAHVLFLNRQLLTHWMESKSPFYHNGVGVFKGELRRAISYGKGLGKEVTINYQQFRLRPEVGGDKKAIVLKSANGDTVNILLDLGLSFEAMPEGLNGLGKQPGTADGMMRLLRYGILPMRPAWYAKDYLWQTVYSKSTKGQENAFWAMASAESIAKDPVAQYLLQELYVRSTRDEIMDKLPREIAESIIKLGPTYVDLWRRGAQHEVAAIVPTHPHADHDGLMPYVTEEAPVIAGAELLAFWKAKTMKAASWRTKLTHVTRLSEPKVGAAYQTIPRETYPYYYSGKPVRVADGVTLYPYAVDHSAPARVQVFKMNFGGVETVLFNSGDWRMDKGGKTQRAMEQAARHKPEYIIMETTNMGGNEKPGGDLGEEDVKDTILSLVKDAGKSSVVVIAPPNNPERIYHLLEIAEATNRKLALGYVPAEMARQFAAAKELAPEGADGFDWTLPYDIGTNALTVWARPMMTPRTHANDMYDIASAGTLGVLDPERLSKEGDRWIVVVSPYEILPDQFDRINYPDGITIIHSAPFAYDRSSKLLLGANIGKNSAWIQQVRANLYIDMDIQGMGGRITPKRFDKKKILHVSGHPTEDQVVDALATLVGDDRRKDVEIISNMSRYDPRDPINTGYSLPMFRGNGVKIILNHGENPEAVAAFIEKRLKRRR